jgi:RNA recognition motif. (a.k.a. RRM, RBD, or RNP domain)
MKPPVNPVAQNLSTNTSNILIPQSQEQNNTLLNGLNLGNGTESSNLNGLNLIELINNIQTVQLLNSLSGANTQNFPTDSKNISAINQIKNPSNNISNHIVNNLNPNQNNLNSANHSNVNQGNNIPNSKSTSFLNSVNKFDDKFKYFLDFKKNATNIVYVEGLPLNATEREVAHIFRPFPGFKSVRLITREKAGEKSMICFADFDDILQSTICINTLQGYRFDKNDLVGLHFSYGVTKTKK